MSDPSPRTQPSSSPTTPSVPTTDVTAPASTSVSTTLMEDAVPASVLSVDIGKKNQVALFANPYKEGQEEALLIDESGKLTYLQRTSTSATGWAQTPVPNIPPAPAKTVTEVVAIIYTPLQEVWAACVDSERAPCPQA
jgi:hypothetical protein